MRHKFFFCYSKLLLVAMAASCAFGLELPVRPAPPVIPDRTMTLQAPADGVTDASAAINSAIKALADEGGGTLEFGPGVYLVKVNAPSHEIVIQTQSNVRLQGSSEGVTIIKMAESQPPYDSIIGSASDVHDVDIENIVINMNGLTNVSKSSADNQLGVRNAVRFIEGERMKVAGCRVLNVADVNTFDFTGSVTDAEAGNNQFPDVGQIPGSFDFDHSTIYAHAVRVWIHDNLFEAAFGPGTPLARTAIETHGDDIAVSNNTIDSYSIGMIITGQAASSNRQLYNGNAIRDIMNGIEIRSEVYVDNSTQGMQNITIENNEVDLNPVVWRASGKVSSTQPSEGIFLNPAPVKAAPINGLAILNNKISFPAVQGPASSGDTYSGGILFWTAFGQQTAISNLTISGNTVTDALGAGIWANDDLEGGAIISSNTITNPARSSGSAERTGIYISGVSAHIQIASNTISDTGVVPLITDGISAVSSCTSACTVGQNTVTPTSVKPVVAGHGWVVKQ